MKGLAFQLIGSSVALALMAGAGSLHWWKLDPGSRVSPGAGWHVISAPREDEAGMVPVSTGGLAAAAERRNTPPSAGSRSEVESATVQALQEVVAVLQAIKSENDDLRDQLMETNRDMNGMQIQIDGYSDEFKPLKLSPTPEGVFDSGNPLLPPKRW